MTPRDKRISSMATTMVKAIGIHNESGLIQGDEYAEAYLRAFIEWNVANYGVKEALERLERSGFDVLVSLNYAVGLTHGA